MHELRTVFERWTLHDSETCFCPEAQVRLCLCSCGEDGDVVHYDVREAPNDVGHQRILQCRKDPSSQVQLFYQGCIGVIACSAVACACHMSCSGQQAAPGPCCRAALVGSVVIHKGGT